MRVMPRAPAACPPGAPPGPPGIQVQLLLLMGLANLPAQQGHPALWVSQGRSGHRAAKAPPRALLCSLPTGLQRPPRLGGQPCWPSWDCSPLRPSGLLPDGTCERAVRAPGGRSLPGCPSPGHTPQGRDRGPASCPPGLRAGRGPGPGLLAHLALVLRRGREEPRAVLLADVDNLEGEDVVGRGLLGGPHHPEGTAPVVTAWTMPAETAPPLSRSRHPAPCPEEHGTWRRPGAERRAAGVQACTLGAAPCGAASRGRVTSLPADATLHGHHPPTSGAAWPLRALHQALRTHTPSTALPREHFKEVTHCSCPPGRVRGLHRGREVYRGEACRARQLGQVCPRGPSGGPGTRLQCRQAEGGEFGGKKRPCPGDPRNLMDQCLLAARC